MKTTLFTLILLLIPAVAFGAFNTNLSYGSIGDEVLELQEFLTDQGVYEGPITGNFYSLTLSGVKRFQAREGIKPVSGYFGPISRTRANEILDASIPANESEPTTEATIKSQIESLLAQIKALQEQIAQQQETQNALLTQQNEILQPTLGSNKTITNTPMPEITLEGHSTNCNVNSTGRYCDVYVFVFEDGKKNKGVKVEISADDDGKFNSNGKGDVDHGFTNGIWKDGTPVARFQYMPSEVGERTVTATVEGKSIEIKSRGQVEKINDK